MTFRKFHFSSGANGQQNLIIFKLSDLFLGIMEMKPNVWVVQIFCITQTWRFGYSIDVFSMDKNEKTCLPTVWNESLALLFFNTKY